MDSIINKAGSYYFGQKANKELSSVTNDLNNLQNSITGGTKKLVNKIKGKVQKPLPELLKEYDIPVGIFPRDATNYEFNEETKKLTVHIPEICEVCYKDSSVVRLNTTVTGHLEKGNFADIEGMKTKVMFLWITVSVVLCEKTDIHFTAGLRRTRSRAVYEVFRDGIGVDKF
ncbi:uncharacterized protein At5g01610-like [Nicotiana tabacum]|uniref:Uncharacterized protein At5g01610-like n=2 Tax=Nicotiana TaxID=4085 RepID=A0A1S4BUB4_TOBAC|nr:PREDICTED: uncharacterized protein At5g01610-like [Nicotiana sylvestris]XP_016492470.1 PREDICTED: uncharacterized protein At5g01610-like [Nicotiana tabacum]